MRPRVSSRSTSRCLCLLRLPVTSIFPSITCFRMQFLRKIWPIQLSFLIFIVCGDFLIPLTVCNTSSLLTRSVQLIFFILQYHITKLPQVSDPLSELSVFIAIQSYAPNVTLPLNFTSNLLMERAFFFGCCFCHDNQPCYVACTLCIIYHASKPLEIFHIFRLVLIHHNLHWEYFPWDPNHLSFFPHLFRFHTILLYHHHHHHPPSLVRPW
jgi:hypothetical protein